MPTIGPARLSFYLRPIDVGFRRLHEGWRIFGAEVVAHASYGRAVAGVCSFEGPSAKSGRSAPAHMLGGVDRRVITVNWALCLTPAVDGCGNALATTQSVAASHGAAVPGRSRPVAVPAVDWRRSRCSPTPMPAVYTGVAALAICSQICVPAQDLAAAEPGFVLEV